MKKYVLYIIIFFCFSQYFYAQEDGVVALALPVRNSLKFNKYAINPAFSFVREQNKYISFTNKREWVEFANPPQTYLFSYAGRFGENVGAGVGLFQQNFGVLTTFGGLVNAAYNVVFDRDNNLTFGMNLGFYQSGINQGNVITNFPDPSIDNTPTNSVITINPGINYGLAFFDFGISINNLVAYNLKSNKMIEDNPEQSFQAHVMYTGYLDSRGFFDESKFSSLVRSEFKKEKTVLSGIMMLTVPKGIWAQVGYNTLFGVSAGIGLNITNQIALEYNYEQAVGDLVEFGNSHEITLAYRFKNKNKYNYSDDDVETALIAPTKKRRSSTPKRTSTGKTDADFRANRIASAQIAAERKARFEEEERLKQEAQDRATEAENVLAEERAKANEEERLKQVAIAEEQARVEKERIRLAEEKAAIAKVEEERLRQIAQAEAKAKEAEKERLRLIAEEAANVKAIEEERIRLEAQAEIQAKIVEEERVRLAAEAEVEAKVQAEAEEKLKLEAENVSVENEAKDETVQSMEDLTKSTDESKIEQQKLLQQLEEKLAIKQQDLKDLKEENDLSEQGIAIEPKPFKSLSAENAALDALILNFDNAIKIQNSKIEELENLYSERFKSVPNKNDSVNQFYAYAIEQLKTDQQQFERAKENIFLTLEEVKVATEIERKRRIKRAAYDNEQDRYLKDRSTLNAIKQNTKLSETPFNIEDFNFGEEQSNIQIIKDVKNVENGYYLVIAVHTDVSLRDEFLRKVVASGQNNINFFYDVTSSKYFIYYENFDDIESAQRALQSKDNEPYNSKMSIVKIEN
jgi:type IX secretion system PorP/SprF family membrane protein